jgi:hypothetical protein
MKSIIKKTVTFAAATAFAFAALLVPVVPANATTPSTPTTPNSCASGAGSYNLNNGKNCAQGAGTPSTLFGSNSIFNTIVNVLLFIIGAISVIMLIWGGIRYTTSAGNSANVTAAKNTIMYAIIGLIFAFLAFAIVNWVLVALTPGNTNT